MGSYRQILSLAAAAALCIAPSVVRADPPSPAPHNIETSFIWSQSEADVKCPAAAAEAGGRWTGQWRISIPGQTSLCEIVDLPKQTRLRTRANESGPRDVEVGPIWNQADAEGKCRRAAEESHGRWTGQWRTTRTGEMSVCQIDYGRPARDVEAGPIWNDADAGVKCPVAAFAVRGVWTGQWRTVVPGQMSVCAIADRD